MIIIVLLIIIIISSSIKMMMINSSSSSMTISFIADYTTNIYKLKYLFYSFTGTTATATFSTTRAILIYRFHLRFTTITSTVGFGIRWGAAEDLLTTAFHSSIAIFSFPQGVSQLKSCPSSDVVFPAFLLPPSPSASIYGTLHGGLGKAR
ncbi:hypothetical protein PoB_003111200 [Plakobranchus ocellatus]|uniref:Cytochrome-c oxidase n=1 Tax=Plakobranchus ocellatus TaxID=259542 RepID=A0AAV4AC45_9GAST|nr:hypothetical protein PoB_003111200 [Plakobranchus ocellatus]